MKIPEEIIGAAETMLRTYGIELRPLLAQSKEEPQTWISLTEAARYAAISRWTLRRWIADGKVRASKSSRARCGRILVSKPSLDNFLSALEVTRRCEKTNNEKKGARENEK